MEDNQIIALYNARDERAITETSDKYGEYCYKIAYNILTDERDSEECLNDTWLRTWHSIPPAQPNSLRYFLSKIVRNLSLDKYRHRHRDKRGNGEIAAALDEMDELTADTVSVEDEVLRREVAEAVNRFLHTLTAEECGVFLCRYYFVDSIPVIAQKYCMQESNVYVLLSRTRKKLREYLKQEGYTV